MSTKISTLKTNRTKSFSLKLNLHYCFPLFTRFESCQITILKQTLKVRVVYLIVVVPFKQFGMPVNANAMKIVIFMASYLYQK
jgi:hypothetical protein